VGVANRKVQGSTQESQSFSYTTPVMSPPDKSADTDTLFTWVHYQLDCIGRDRDILDGLLLLGDGFHERLQGGLMLLQHSCQCL
jgi:hypothetical protein